MKRSRSITAIPRDSSRSCFLLRLTIVAVAILPLSSSMTPPSQSSDRRDDNERLLMREKSVQLLRPDFLPPITRANQIRSVPSSSLADRLNDLLNQNGVQVLDTEFVQRLRSEEQTSSVEKQNNQNTFLLASIGMSIALLIASNWLSAQGFGSVSLIAVASDLYQTVASSLGVFWLPFLWIPLSTWKWSDLSCYVEMIVRPELFAYVRDQVLPYTGAILRKMIVNEMWRQFWSVAFKQLSAMLKPSSSGTDQAGKKWEVPMWLSKLQLFVFTAVERGTQRTFRTMLQPHLQESIATVSRAVGGVLQQQYQTIFTM